MLFLPVSHIEGQATVFAKPAIRCLAVSNYVSLDLAPGPNPLCKIQLSYS